MLVNGLVRHALVNHAAGLESADFEWVADMGLAMIRSTVGATRDVFDWWLGELRATFGMRGDTNASVRTQNIVVIINDDLAEVWSEHGEQRRKLQTLALTDASLGRAVRGLKEHHGASRVGVRVPIGICLERAVVVPRRAERHIREILDLDLEATTPIRPGDVYTAHVVEEGPGDANGKLKVRHLVVKRNRVDPVVEALADADLTVAFVDCSVAPDQSPLKLSFLDNDRGAAGKGTRRAALTTSLVLLALTLGAVAEGVWLWRNEQALQTLRVEADRLQSGVTDLKARIGKLSDYEADVLAVHQASQAELPLRIIEELSAVLPVDTWLTDLAIKSGQVDVSGFSRSAAALLPVIEESELFASPRLTAPIMYDARQGKDRFSMRMTIAGSTATNSQDQPAQEAER